MLVLAANQRDWLPNSGWLAVEKVFKLKSFLGIFHFVFILPVMQNP